MPLTGSIGAISAANRSARRRHPMTGQSSTGYPSMRVSKANDWETASSSTVDSKSSVFSKLKEAGGYLKKKQQALAEKVQKGLKMTSGSVNHQQNPSEAFQATDAGTTSAPVDAQTLRGTTSAPVDARQQADPFLRATNDTTTQGHERHHDWIDTLAAMGFERHCIQDAIAYLGKRAKNIDHVVELLVARANQEAVKSSGASSSSSFWVTLKRGPKDRLGLTVDTSSSLDRLQIDEVCEGLVASWNMHQPTLNVKAGDYITEVNGIRGSPEVLIKALASGSTIKMSVTTGSSKAPASEAKVAEPSFGSSAWTSSSSSSSSASAIGCGVAEPTLETVLRGPSSSSVGFENPQEAMEEEVEVPEAAVDLIQEESESEEPYYAPTIQCVDIDEEVDEVSIPELASKIIELAFVHASDVLMKEQQAEISAKEKAEGMSKQAEQDASRKTPPSPVRGGA